MACRIMNNTIAYGRTKIHDNGIHRIVISCDQFHADLLNLNFLLKINRTSLIVQLFGYVLITSHLNYTQIEEKIILLVQAKY